MLVYDGVYDILLISHDTRAARKCL